jgi:hypothetical protein
MEYSVVCIFRTAQQRELYWEIQDSTFWSNLLFQVLRTKIWLQLEELAYRAQERILIVLRIEQYNVSHKTEN